MNTNNLSRDFHDISNADWRKHWTWSLFFRNVWLCDRLQYHKTVVEIGSANSILYEYLRKNYAWKGKYFRFDVMEYDGVEYGDIVKGLDLPDNFTSAIVMAEVIEHIPVDMGDRVMWNVHKLLQPDGNVYLTSPTPHKDDGIDLVWPESHDFEYSLEELRDLVGVYFNIAEEFPWHSRKVMEGYDNGMFGTFAKAYKTLTIPIEDATQVAMTLEKL